MYLDKGMNRADAAIKASDTIDDFLTACEKSKKPIFKIKIFNNGLWDWFNRENKWNDSSINNNERDNWGKSSRPIIRKRWSLEKRFNISPDDDE